MPRQRNGGFATACRRRYYQDAPSLRSPARGGRRQGSERNRSKTRGVIAGLVPAISIRMAQCPIIGIAGTSPSVTKWGCHECCPCYQSPIEAFRNPPGLLPEWDSRTDVRGTLHQIPLRFVAEHD